MKITITKDMEMSNIHKYLYPVEKYNQEKIDNNMYDDWNELEHTIKWIEKILKSIKENKSDNLDIYYLKDKEKIIGVILCLSGNNNVYHFLKEYNIKTNKNIALLSCFHILKEYRGIGKKWLEEEIFPDIKKQGIEAIYIKSSHNKALSLYNRIGNVIGNYIGISDHKLYQRYGYVYEINI